MLRTARRSAARPKYASLIRASRAQRWRIGYCVDHRLLHTGSANFSRSGETRQDNDRVALRAGSVGAARSSLLISGCLVNRGCEIPSEIRLVRTRLPIRTAPQIAKSRLAVSSSSTCVFSAVSHICSTVIASRLARKASSALRTA
jgi:hypothetical protein